MGPRDVSLAFGDDAKGIMGARDVTLAFDDAAMGTIGKGM